MNRSKIVDRETLPRTKSGSLTRNAAEFDDDQVVGQKSPWEKRKNNMSMLGAGLDDIEKDQDGTMNPPVEIELSSIIRDVDVGQINLEFDIDNNQAPDYDDYPAIDMDEPLSPSPRDSEPSELKQSSALVEATAEDFKLKLIKSD
jgi:hypothetical protein